MTRKMYNRLFWELCYCVRCGRLNYVEPCKTTAKCDCSPLKTEHQRIPMKYKIAGGTIYTGPPRLGESLTELFCAHRLSGENVK